MDKFGLVSSRTNREEVLPVCCIHCLKYPPNPQINSAEHWVQNELSLIPSLCNEQSKQTISLKKIRSKNIYFKIFSILLLELNRIFNRESEWMMLLCDKILLLPRFFFSTPLRIPLSPLTRINDCFERIKGENSRVVMLFLHYHRYIHVWAWCTLVKGKENSDLF